MPPLKPIKPVKKQALVPQPVAQRLIEGLRRRYAVQPTARPKANAPSMPADLALLPDTALARLQGEYTAWANYLQDVMATEDVERWETDNTEDEVAAIQRIKAIAKNAQARRDVALLAPAAVQARKVAREQRARAHLLASKLLQYDRALKTLSREQTRRDNEREARRQRGEA